METGGTKTMKTKLIATVALIALMLIVPAAIAVSTGTGTPAQTGMLRIQIQRLDAYDQGSWDRYVSIAPYGPEPVIHPEISLNGQGDITLPAGQYYVVLPKGHGSGYDMDTWKPEAFDITIASGTTTVTFIGAGY
jgi:hypothetical protein